jgi:hypothetical protein
MVSANTLHTFPPTPSSPVRGSVGRGWSLQTAKQLHTKQKNVSFLPRSWVVSAIFFCISFFLFPGVIIFFLQFFFCQQGPPYLHSRRTSVRQQGLSYLHSRRALVRQQGLPYLLSRRAYVLGEDLYTQDWERPQRVLRSGKTLVGRLLAGSPSAVLQSGGGRPVALVLCGAGSREVFGHLRLAGPTDYTRFRDGDQMAPAGCSGGLLAQSCRPLAWLGFKGEPPLGRRRTCVWGVWGSGCW